jgi:hypothetical protein
MRRIARRWQFYSAIVMFFGLVISAGDWFDIAAFDILYIGVGVLLLGFLGFVGSIASG